MNTITPRLAVIFFITTVVSIAIILAIVALTVTETIQHMERTCRTETVAQYVGGMCTEEGYIGGQTRHIEVTNCN